LHDIRVYAADEFLRSISNTDSNVYATFGKVDGWSNEANPPTANSSYSTVVEVWRNMIGAKKLTGSNVSLATRRNDWTANTVYDQYDHTNPNLYLSNQQFFIVTSDYNVYKCLSNAGGANSTIEPTAVNANNITNTADGYTWKYMFTVREADRIKFMTENYVPVRELTTDDNSLQWDVQQAAIEGTIYATKVTNGGSGYSNSSNVTITFTGDGEDAAANVTLNTVTNTVNTIEMTTYGTEYSRATATITGGGGSGATVVPLLSPHKGHGSEPVYELGGAFLVINIRLESDENGAFSVQNEYRQIALIKDPLEYAGVNVASNGTISQSMDITVSGSGATYSEDEQVYQGASLAAATFSGRVIEYDESNTLLRVIDTVGTPTNELLIGANTTASKFVVSVDNPGLKSYSGRLIHLDNIVAIERNTDQTEDFKIVVGF